MRPQLFIASSTESLPLAQVVKECLRRSAQVTLWVDAFPPGSFTLDALLAAANRNDFGLFVFAPDDEIRIGERDLMAPRDNVVFEAGLFIGRLGIGRSFVLEPHHPLGRHHPAHPRELRRLSDLDGVTTLRYRHPRQAASRSGAIKQYQDALKEAVKPACTKLARVMKTGLREEFDREPDPDSLALMLNPSLSYWERVQLKKLARPERFSFTRTGFFLAELRRLVQLRLISSLPGKGNIDEMPNRGNAKDYFRVTKRGLRYLAVIRQLEDRHD